MKTAFLVGTFVCGPYGQVVLFRASVYGEPAESLDGNDVPGSALVTLHHASDTTYAQAVAHLLLELCLKERRLGPAWGRIRALCQRAVQEQYPTIYEGEFLTHLQHAASNETTARFWREIADAVADTEST